MQKNYELLVVLDSEISDEDIDVKVEKIKQVIIKMGGEVKSVNKWGKRRLAYEIKKSKKGFYLLIYFVLNPDLIKELEQDLKFVEGINRFIIVGIPEASSFPVSGADLEISEEAV